MTHRTPTSFIQDEAGSLPWVYSSLVTDDMCLCRPLRDVVGVPGTSEVLLDRVACLGEVGVAIQRRHARIRRHAVLAPGCSRASSGCACRSSASCRVSGALLAE